MSEQGWLKREMEIVQREVATWPAWKRGEGMDDVKRYKLFQDVRYDDGAFVIPAGQVVIREADYDVLRDQRDRLRAALQAFCDEVEMDAAVMAYKCDLGAGEWEAFIDRTKLYKQYLEAKAALTPAGGGQHE